MMALFDGDDYVRLSFSAGAYLCNMNYYLALDHARRHGKPSAVGFVHIPVFGDNTTNEEQLDRHVKLLQKIIREVIRNHRTL
jgi:pyrrolidone-carboxylate peptidase